MVPSACIKRGVLATLAALSIIPISTEARVVRIVSMSPPTVAFGGYSWPGVGQYHKITGVAYAEVDPNDRRNHDIVDLKRAQPQSGPLQPGKTAQGKVGYLFNFYILKPADVDQVDRKLNGYRKVMYEPPNRGGKTWTALGRVSGGGNDPATIVDPVVLQNSFLMPRGYTLVWSGWEPLVPAASLATSLTASAALPIAVNPNGSAITGPSYEYIVSSASSFTLSYPAANAADTSTAKLTHRVHLNDTPVAVPPATPGNAGWQYTGGGTAIRLVDAAGAPVAFTANDIYEFSYTAKDPWVAGLGFAAVRDWMSWLRYADRDDAGTPNPLANYIKRVYTEISSQPGRMFNDFRHLGFNESDMGHGGRKVFDGHMQWIAAGSGIGLNYRFSQSGRTERNRQDHRYPENLFPFANVETTDPFTGRRDGRLEKCEATHTCPLAVEIYSANEYWVKSASLLHTTPDGRRDLRDSRYARNYFMSSMRHGTGSATNRGACQQFDNPLSSSPVQRALFLALDAWADDGDDPPDSRVPRLDNGTLVLPAHTGFPTNIPDPFGETPNGKVTYTGLKTTRYRYLMGESFYTSGIPTNVPPKMDAPYQVDTPVPFVSHNGPVYPSFVPKTDRDGNDIAGVRLPDVTVPLATYTGWALRRGAWANDGCEGSGQSIAFQKTKADREAKGDPRRSVQERYPTFVAYQNAVIRAIDDMVKDRFLLCEDAVNELPRLITAGLAAGVPAASNPGEVKTEIPQCRPRKHGHDDDHGHGKH
ncbi:MAG TPA: alpha/beta hydrolase domain-containing protein [Burkholderiales bacterium]|nr:alpha/beta hydrolase domain-containing protein [Burkholderiales bacterium]